MEAQIKITKTAAIKAGKDMAGVHRVDFDPADLTQGQRDELAKLVRGDEVVVEIGQVPIPDQVTAETLKSILDVRIAEVEKRRREATKRAIEEAALKIKAWDEWLGSEEKLVYRGGEWRADCPSTHITSELSHNLPKDHVFWNKLRWVEAVREEFEAKAEELNAEQRKERDAAAEQRQAERRAAEQRRDLEIKSWVQLLGDENMKGRLQEGLLGEDEVLDLVRDHVYRPLDDFPRYKKLRASDFECDCPCEFECKTVDPLLSAEEYTALLSLRQAAEHLKTAHGAEISVEPRRHVCTCTCCEDDVRRLGVMVRARIGELEFSREYGLDEE